ncbi:MAG: TraB/GumN family protein [Thermoanaerobaculia bacterium]|nr:TraB/GumN family protein [Thermoanaerobaculia bacterium]
MRSLWLPGGASGTIAIPRPLAAAAAGRGNGGPSPPSDAMVDSSSPPDTTLPETVHELDVDGRRIYLVGTAHVSHRSVDDVRTTLEAIAPDSVCVELCPSRYESLTNPDSWRKLNVLEVLKAGKAPLLLSSLIMASFQRRIADRLGIVPGAEMLAGIEGAEAGGAELVLADRAIETTLRRTGARLGFWTKIKIFSQLLAGLFVGEDIDEAEIEKLKEEARLSDALQALAQEFPAAKETLIDERDRFLAQRIREAPGETVVAVVGAGHIAGIKHHIGADADIAELDEVPPPSLVPRILKWAIPAAIVALLAFGFVTGGAERSRESLLLWVLINGGLSALGSALALGHPLTVVSAFVAAPLTSLNPFLAAGWVAGLVQAWIKNPTVEDLEGLPEAITSVGGFWRNAVTRVLLVVVLANLGSTLGTFIAGTLIAARTL